MKHVCTPPYHPSSNGLVERAVQSLKRGLKKFESGSLDTKLSRFLFSYRATPHSSTGLSPAELMFGRKLHSPLDNLRPNLGRQMHQEQERQRSIHDRRTRPREFALEDLVYAQNYGPGAKWLPGRVSRTVGSAMFEVTLTDGRQIRRHADQLRSRAPATVNQGVGRESEPDDDFDMSIPNTGEVPESSNSDLEAEQSDATPTETDTPRTTDESNESSPSRDASESRPHMPSEGDTIGTNPSIDTGQPSVRRSGRARNPPTYYGHSELVT